MAFKYCGDVSPLRNNGKSWYIFACSRMPVQDCHSSSSGFLLNCSMNTHCMFLAWLHLVLPQGGETGPFNKEVQKACDEVVCVTARRNFVSVILIKSMFLFRVSGAKQTFWQQVMAYTLNWLDLSAFLWCIAVQQFDQSMWEKLYFDSKILDIQRF